jgi:hypothetical protein
MSALLFLLESIIYLYLMCNFIMSLYVECLNIRPYLKLLVFFYVYAK